MDSGLLLGARQTEQGCRGEHDATAKMTRWSGGIMRKHKLSNNGGKVQVSMVINVLLLILSVQFVQSRDFRQF